MDRSTVDHRWGLRVAIDMPVHLISPLHAALACRIREISISGAVVETRIALPEMTRVAVRFEQVGALKHRPRTIPGYVARSLQNGVALGWMQLSPAIISELIAATLAPPGRLDTLLPSQMYY